MAGHRLIFTITLLLAFVFATNSLHAELYQWVDENGVRRFSNTAPPENCEDLKTSQEIKGGPNGYQEVRKEYSQSLREYTEKKQAEEKRQQQLEAQEAEKYKRAYYALKRLDSDTETGVIWRDYSRDLNTATHEMALLSASETERPRYQSLKQILTHYETASDLWNAVLQDDEPEALETLRPLDDKYDWFMFRSAEFHTGKAASSRFNWRLASETARSRLWKMASDAMAEHEEQF